MRCPGQDKRYWKEDAVFEVPCPKCGYSVELFKDENKARCPKCSHRFQNPKLNLECAKWCAHAADCVELPPPSEETSNLGEGSLASLLIRAVKDEFHEDQARITHALVVFQHAKELAARTGGDARVILAAALLLEIAAHGSPAARNPRAVLEEIGLPDEVTGAVDRIIAACQGAACQGGDDSIEYLVVRDSHRLTDLAAEDHDEKQLRDLIDQQLGTDAAKARAEDMFQI